MVLVLLSLSGEANVAVNDFSLFQPNLVPMPSWVSLWLYAKLVLLRRVSLCTVTLLTLLEIQKSSSQFL